MDPYQIKQRLDEIYRAYHRPCYLAMDPLVCVHRFGEDGQIEIAGIVASALAYGRVEQIIASVNRVFEITGPDLLQFSSITSFREKSALLADFKHRFNDGIDIALLFECVKHVLAEHGSPGGLFASAYRPVDRDIGNALDSYVRYFRSRALEILGFRKKTFEYLFPMPSSGSACKRMNLYLRWMVRVRDGLDFGIWKDIPTQKLVIPLDTHVARIGAALGFTGRKTADWRMALEITDSLKKIDPDDPLKYDFSMCRAGMVDVREGVVIPEKHGILPGNQ